MQSNVTRITSDGVFVTLPSDVQEELVEFCKMHGVCPEWMSVGLKDKIELGQYEELRLLLRNNGETDLPGLAVFADVGTDDDYGVIAAGYAYDAGGELIQSNIMNVKGKLVSEEEFEHQPSSSRTRHKSN